MDAHRALAQRLLRLTPLVLALLLSAACTRTLKDPPFSAANTYRAEGRVWVGEVSRLLEDRGLFASTRIYHSNNTAVGWDTPIKDYVRRALAQELEKSGFIGQDPRLLLDCHIERFGIQQNAFSVDIIFHGNLALRRPDVAAGETEISREFELSRHHGGGTTMRTVRAELNQMITEAYDDFFRDPEVRERVDAVRGQ